MEIAPLMTHIYETDGLSGTPPKYYGEASKKAIYKHREKNREGYNERQRKYYTEKSLDEEWKQKFNDRCKEANRKYREKKALEHPPQPRGRPRKDGVVMGTIEL